MYYIRFTEDIYADIDRGNSIDFRDKSKMNGLCAWKITEDYDPYNDDSIVSAAEKTAKKVAKNSYGGYSSNSCYAVVEGKLTGGYSNDGYLIKIERVLAVNEL